MNNRAQMLENEKVSKLLSNLAVPATISMLVNAMYNIIDTIFIGKGVGSLGIAGVAIYLPIQMIMMAFAQMVGIGSGSYVSRLIGKKNYDKLNNVAGTAIALISAISVVFLISGVVFLDNILGFFGASSAVLPYAREYAFYMLIGVLFFPLVVSSSSLMRSEGNVKDATVSMIIGFVINIILDYVFIFTFDMGIRGAAIATTLAKFVQFGYIVAYFKSKRTMFKLKVSNFKIRTDIVKEITAVGMSAFWLSAAESLVAMAVNRSLLYYGGDLSIVIYGIVYKIMLFSYMPLKGLMQGLQPIIGYSWGAGRYDRMNESIRLSALSSVVIGSLFWIAVQFFPTQIVSLFTSDPDIVESSKSIIRIVAFAIPVIGLQLIGTTLYQSIGEAKKSMVFALLRQVFFFLPLLAVLPKVSGLGILAIWLAFPISDLLSVLITSIFVSKDLKNKKDLSLAS